MTLTVGVLASGSGTNLQAILDACAAGGLPARVGVVICNVPGVRAIERARDAGVPCHVIPHAGKGRAEFEALIQHQLDQHKVELLVLAGFMRVLTADFVSAWRGRLINIHPSLLPAFKGLHAVRQALDYGVRWTGCTVHFVDEGVDSGPIIVQAVVPIEDGDTEQTLHARVQREEHRLLPEAVRLFAEGRVRVDGRRVYLSGEAT